MYEYFTGEIILFAGTYVPQGWAICDGRLLPVAAHEALFSLIGTSYGGDGQANFAVPDLRGRIPVHRSAEQVLGSRGGEEMANLTESQIPPHTHALNATTTAATSPSPLALPAKAAVKSYLGGAATESMSQMAVSREVNGGVAGKPHSNMQPFLCLNFIICLDGTFPA